MKILILGGAGFIGSHISATLMAAGHELIIGGRHIASMERRFPGIKKLQIDFSELVTVESWLTRLKNIGPIDAVINCVGVLNTLQEKEIMAIHCDSPLALFQASESLGISIKIHLSAMGIDLSESVPYAYSKKILEQKLFDQNLRVTILRPSFVYSSGSYGGSSLFRALAAFPFFIPLAGKGDTRFQPIHAQDLAQMVLNLLDQKTHKTEILTLAGPEVVDMKTLLQKLRTWLGLKPAGFMALNFRFLKILAPLGDIFSWIPINSTTVGMMQESDFSLLDSKLDSNLLEKIIHRTGVNPRSFTQGLQIEPAAVQDVWHAKLFFMHPLLRVTLAVLWILSGLSGFLMQEKAHALLAQAGISMAWENLALNISCGLDIVLGVWVFTGFFRNFANYFQLALVLIYTGIITFKMPLFWLDPFGSLSKNLAVLLCILILMVVGKER
jgi:uncharacterized protein YbjT (DUF2867 family)